LLFPTFTADDSKESLSGERGVAALYEMLANLEGIEVSNPMHFLKQPKQYGTLTDMLDPKNTPPIIPATLAFEYNVKLLWAFLCESQFKSFRKVEGKDGVVKEYHSGGCLTCDFLLHRAAYLLTVQPWGTGYREWTTAGELTKHIDTHKKWNEKPFSNPMVTSTGK
jgi:hypothetical protein